MKIVFSAWLVLLLAVTACGQAKKARTGKANDIKLANAWALSGFYISGTIEYDTLTPARIIISNDEKHFTGSTGCNSMRGPIAKGENFEIKLGPVDNLSKRCAFEITENKFLDAIKCTDRYSIKGEYLTLYCAGKPVVQLKHVKK